MWDTVGFAKLVGSSLHREEARNAVFFFFFFVFFVFFFFVFFLFVFFFCCFFFFVFFFFVNLFRQQMHGSNMSNHIISRVHLYMITYDHIIIIINYHTSFRNRLISVALVPFEHHVPVLAMHWFFPQLRNRIDCSSFRRCCFAATRAQSSTDLSRERYW